MKKFDKCSICRRAGEKLFLKGEKCNLPSCPVTRRSYRPGQHGNKAIKGRKISDYAIQLNEKQKAKAIYGLSESQLRTYFEKARMVKGATGQTLMNLLESRLDNVVYKASPAKSRSEAKQFVSHGNVKVNGKKVKSSSTLVKKGDKIEIKKIEGDAKKDIPDWLKSKNNTIEISGDPTFDHEQSIINEQLIIEYFSR